MASCEQSMSTYRVQKLDELWMNYAERRPTVFTTTCGNILCMATTPSVTTLTTLRYSCSMTSHLTQPNKFSLNAVTVPSPPSTDICVHQLSISTADCFCLSICLCPSVYKLYCSTQVNVCIEYLDLHSWHMCLWRTPVDGASWWQLLSVRQPPLRSILSIYRRHSSYMTRRVAVVDIVAPLVEIKFSVHGHITWPATASSPIWSDCIVWLADNCW